MINKQGVPWCSEEACEYFLDIGDAPIYECTAGKFCFEIPADPETLLCLPKVQAMAAENEQLRRMVTTLFNRRHEKEGESQ